MGKSQHPAEYESTQPWVEGDGTGPEGPGPGPGPPRVRVLLVDDHPVVRDGLRAALKVDTGIEVVGEAGRAVEALEAADILKPDVVVTDVRMPGMSGIELTHLIRSTRPGISVVLLSMYAHETYLLDALRAGASGYITKDAPVEVLCHAINAAASGCTTVYGRLLQSAVQGLPTASQTGDRRPNEEPGTNQLTNREREILVMVSQGYANKTIAAELKLAEVTIKKHLHSVFGKLGTSDRTHASIVAVRMGLLE